MKNEFLDGLPLGNIYKKHLMQTFKDSNGWEYIYNNDSYQLIPNENDKKMTPEYLYKFLSLKRGIELLKSERIFLSSHLNFNDVYDSSSLLIDMDDKEFAIEFLKDIEGVEITKIIEEWDKYRSDVAFHYCIQSYIFSGISCFTDNWNNILMWAYYNNNQGVCFEFDPQLFGFNFLGPYQVNYKNEFEKIPFSKGKELAYLYMTNVKSRIWQHENEWRIIVPGTYKLDEYWHAKNLPEGKDRFANIKPKSINKILLGYNYFPASLERRSVSSDTIEIIDINAERLEMMRLIEKHKIDCYITTVNNKSYDLGLEKLEIQDISEEIVTVKVINVA